MSGVLHEAMSSRGTTGNTQVQSPLNATTATGKETLKLLDVVGGVEMGVGAGGAASALGFITSFKLLSQSLGSGDAFYFFTEKTHEIWVPSCV